MAGFKISQTKGWTKILIIAGCVIFIGLAVVNYLGWYFLGRSQRATGIEARRQELVRAVRFGWPNHEAWRELGRSYLDEALAGVAESVVFSEKRRQAEQAFRRAIKINPLDRFSHFYFAQLLLYGAYLGKKGEAPPGGGKRPVSSGRPASPFKELQRAALLAGHQSDVYFNVGQVFLRYWDELDEEERSFAVSLLNRIIEEGDRSRFLSLLHTWFMNVGDFDVLRRILPQKASFYGETARFIALMGLPEEKFLEFSRAAEAMRFELAREAFDQGKIHFAYYTISRAESYFRRALSLLDKIRFIPGGAGGSGAGSVGSAGGAAGGAEGGVPGRSVAVGSVMGGEEGNGPGVVGRGGSVRGGGVLCGVEEETKEDLPRVTSGEAFRGEGGGRPGEVERSVLEGDGGSVPGGDGEEMLRGVLVEVPEKARNQEKIGPAIDRREAVERGNVFGSPGSIGARFQVQEEEEREEAKEKVKGIRIGIGVGIGMGMEIGIGMEMGVEMGREMCREMGREMGSYDQTSFQGEVDPQGVSGNSIKLTEFDALYRSTLLYLLRCRIEQKAEWAEIDGLVRRYLRTKPIPADVNSLEEYLVEKGFLASDLAKEMGDLPRLALQARLAFQANRYRQLMQLGRQLEKSFVVVPAEQRAAYGEVLRLVGDSFQKLDFVYDAERFYEKAVEVDPGNGEGLLRLRKNYIRLNELEKAKEVEARLDELILTGRIGPSGVGREKGAGSRSGLRPLVVSSRIIRLKPLGGSRGGGRGGWLEVAANKLGRWSLWLDGRPVELTLRAAGLLETAMGRGGQEMGKGQPFALLSSPRLREGLALARGVFAAVYWNKKLVWAGYLNDQKAEEVKFNLFSREGNNLLEIQALRRPLTFQLHLPAYEIK